MRFTEYASDSIGTVKHTIDAARDVDGWTLTIVASPVRPVMPPADVELTGAEFWAFIRAQSTPIASRRAPLCVIGGTDYRPGPEAAALARHLLGEAWTVVDKGQGFLVEVR